MRIAIIGYGNIAKRHIEVFRALDCEVVASCNRNEANNLKACEEGSILRTYVNYVQMIEKEKPDAIINCASFNNIYDTTRTLIPYRIPLLIEKPAGTTVAELKDLIQLQYKHQTKVQVGLNRRHYSVIHKAIEDAGGISAVNMFTVEWSENPLKVKETKNYSDQQLEMLICGNSIHGLDAMAWYTGGIANYQVNTRVTSDFFGWNMVLSGVSKKGILLSFSSSWNSPVPWRFVMYATNKRYEFAPLEKCRVFENNSLQYREIQPDEVDLKYKAGFYGQAVSFLKIVKGESSGENFNLSSCLDSMQLAEDLLSNISTQRNLNNNSNVK